MFHFMVFLKLCSLQIAVPVGCCSSSRGQSVKCNKFGSVKSRVLFQSGRKIVCSELQRSRKTKKYDTLDNSKQVEV